MSEIIRVNRGSDKTLHFEWKDSVGTAVPISNPRIIDATTKLNLTIIEVDYSLGVFDVKLEGTVAIAKGFHSFRVQADVSGGDSSASPEVVINVL